MNTTPTDTAKPEVSTDTENGQLVRLTTFNAKRGFWDDDRGRHDLDSVMANLNQAPLPDSLGFSEATRFQHEGHRALYRLAAMLTEANYGDRVEPFLAEFDGHANHPALLVNTRVVEIKEWWNPHRPGTRRVKWGWLRADVWGVDTWISCQHFQGGLGRHKFDEHAAILAEIGRRPAIALGDFNATSSWDGEVEVDWHTATDTAGQKSKRLQKGHQVGDNWQLDTRQLDYLRQECGWRDLGEEAKDNRVTTNENDAALRIDRIMLSASFPGYLIPGTYAVHEPRTISAVGNCGPPAGNWVKKSDHKMVSAMIRIPGPGDTTS
jgi:endonuclease/exonuclease/phosphatase family metal-dependent hydrolase